MGQSPVNMNGPQPAAVPVPRTKAVLLTMTDQRFRPEYRIRRTVDFQRAYQRRCTAGDRTLLVFARRNGLPGPRLGLSVSRKVGGAVGRNRWKRLLREAFRIEREKLPAGIDLVVIPRPGAEARLTSLRQSLRELARRAARKLDRIEAAGVASSQTAAPCGPGKEKAHGE